MLAAFANFEPNSPNDRNCPRSSMSPNVAMSQNAVDPPLPSTTSVAPVVRTDRAGLAEDASPHP